VIFYLQYTAATFGGTMIINSEAFSPSAILKAVITPGIPEPKPKTWSKMFFKTGVEE
jgi:hypothetical protein